MKMKYVYSLLLVLIGSIAFAQTPSLQWQKSLGGTGTDEARSVYQTSDGGSIIAGNSNSTNGDVLGNHGSYDYWLIKMDAAGNVQWKKTYGGTASDKGYAVIQLSYGGYVVVGNASSNDGDVTGNHGASDYWIVRLNSIGNIVWQKSIGGTSSDIARGVIQTLDGKLMVIGYSRSSNGDVTGAHGGFDFWLTKIDTAGNLLWQKTYGGTKDELAYTVKQAADSSLLIVGYTLSNDGDIAGLNHSTKNDIWVVKTDKAGSILWQKTLGGTSNDYSNSFIRTSDKGYLIIGYTESYNGDVYGNYGQDDLWVIKLDSLGTIQWQQTYGGTDNDRANYAAETSDGGFVVSGHSESNDIDLNQNYGDKDFWMLRLNQSGILEWKKSVGGNLEDNSYSVAQSSDGGIIAVGISASNTNDVTVNNGGDDFWIVKISNLSVLAPKKSDIWFSGTSRNIKWKSNGSSSLKIEYSINGGNLYSTIVASTPAASSQYSWTIPNGINSKNCKIKITDVANTSNLATSDSLFSILTSPAILIPNGGEVYVANSTCYIYWYSELTSTTFNLEYTLDGTNWLPIANAVVAYPNSAGNNSGFYAWTVPNVNSTTCKVRITDATNSSLTSSSASFFSITQQKSLDLLVPSASGLSFSGASSIYISWNSQGVTHVNLFFSSDGGANYTQLVNNYANTGYYNWLLPNINSANCLIKIVDANSATQDISSSNFAIVPPTTSLNLLAPNGGEKWYVGNSYSIAWSSSQITQVKLELNSGSGWTTLASSIPAINGSYYWNVAPIISTTCRIRISDASNASVFDVSNLDFEIADTVKSLSLITPNGGEQWQAGSYKPIIFTSNNITNFDLFYSTDTGYTWNLISNSVSSSPYFWLVPNSQSTRCLLRISNGGNVIDYSATFFTITAPFTGTPPAITTSAVPSFCKNAAFSVNFSIGGTFNPGNYFIAQLSDENGNFSLPTSIGSLQSTAAGAMPCVVPEYVTNGSGYRIRVVADNPPTIGANNGSNITINSPEFTFPPARVYYSLPNIFAYFTYTGNSVGVASYLWNFGDNTTSTTANAFHTYTKVGTFDVSLTVTSTNGCSITKTNTNYIRVDNTFPNLPLFPNTNSDITGISLQNDSIACVSLETGECLLTTDGGNIWIPKINTGINDASSVAIMSGKWLMTSKEGKVVESTDLGANWQTVPQNISAQQSLNDVSLSSPTSGWVVGKSGTMFQYNSGNLNFEISGTNNNLNSVKDGGSWATAVGDNGTIVRNNGGAWFTQTSGVTTNLRSVAFANAQVGYACGDNGRVLKTTNGGNTWTNSLPPGSEINFSSVEVCGLDSAWVVGTKGILYETVDGGVTWTRFTKGVTNDNTRIAFKQPKGVIAGGTGSLRTFQASPVTGISKIKLLPHNFYHLFPNPSNGNFSLKILSGTQKNTDVKVFSSSGNLITQISLPAMPAGFQKEFDLSQFDSGIYFLQLENSTNFFVEKIMLIK
jgi:photosystem II stability/assembly factor-like uncharacterized protein